jgi:hypothetical protein
VTASQEITRPPERISSRPLTLAFRGDLAKDAELLVVRHEALSVPNGGGRPSSPCRRSGGVKLEAASPRVGGDGGSSLDKVASFQHCRMGRAR